METLPLLTKFIGVHADFNLKAAVDKAAKKDNIYPSVWVRRRITEILKGEGLL